MSLDTNLADLVKVVSSSRADPRIANPWTFEVTRYCRFPDAAE